ncbi:MAG: hypothetical protein NTU63_01150 [Candidatus Pacearchaeota archaeon]|nr:hypothetical protein [Candidatus Pacearchaeota archaeon]
MNTFTITQGDEKLFELYHEYNPNEDPSGSIGIGIAEAVYHRFGGDWGKIELWNSLMKMRKASLEKQARLS